MIVPYPCVSSSFVFVSEIKLIFNSEKKLFYFQLFPDFW